MRDDLIKLHRRLTHNIQKEIIRIQGCDSKELQLYKREYTQGVRTLLQSIDRVQWAEEIAHTPFLFVGDYHTHHAGINCARDICSSLLSKGHAPILVLECFQTNDEKNIELFMKNEMTSEDLKKKSGWEKNWGFPWEYTEKILLYCREKNITVRALRESPWVKNPLKIQDALFAKKLKKIAESLPPGKNYNIVTLVGELHCAPSHLPLQLSQMIGPSTSSTIMLQDVDDVFWLQSQNKDIEKDALFKSKIGKQNLFFINQTSPWVKHESHLKWLQSTMDEDADELSLNEEKIKSQIKTLSDFLEIPKNLIPKEVNCLESSDFTYLSTQLAPKFDGKVQLWLVEREYLAIPNTTYVYARDFHPKTLSLLSASFLYNASSLLQGTFSELNRDFYRFIIAGAMEFFGARVLIPQIKAHTQEQLLVALASKDRSLSMHGLGCPTRWERKRLEQFYREHIEKVHTQRHWKEFTPSFPEISMHQERPYYWMATQMGYTLGDALYESALKNKDVLQNVKNLWRTQIESSEAALKVYLDCEALISPQTSHRPNTQKRVLSN